MPGVAWSMVEPEPARAQTILVVDDEPDILRAMADYLRATVTGTALRTAGDGASALELLREEAVDLIISDFKMPGMDGLAFLAQAREIAPGVPRVLMTAFPDMDLAIRALNEERIQHFFTKPIEPEAMRAIVQGLLTEQRARRQREQALRRSVELMRSGRSGAKPSQREASR